MTAFMLGGAYALKHCFGQSRFFRVMILVIARGQDKRLVGALLAQPDI